MALRAKYQGICKASGKVINPGDLIEKGPSGWALASELKKAKVAGADYVLAYGPDSDQDRWGDEFPIWYVFVCKLDDEGSEIFLSEETVYSREHAIDRGDELAQINGVEFVNEASFA